MINNSKDKEQNNKQQKTNYFNNKIKKIVKSTKFKPKIFKIK